MIERREGGCHVDEERSEGRREGVREGGRERGRECEGKAKVTRQQRRREEGKGVRLIKRRKSERVCEGEERGSETAKEAKRGLTLCASGLGYHVITGGW